MNQNEKDLINNNYEEKKVVNNNLENVNYYNYLSNEQIKKIKWRTYLNVFAFPFFFFYALLWLIIIGLTKLDLKVNDKELNLLFNLNFTSKTGMILIFILIFYISWPVFIFIQWILYLRIKLPKKYSPDIIQSIIALKKQYVKHGIIFWFLFLSIFLIPLLIIGIKKLIKWKRG
jgi:ABC-type multidrug transport system fused ATPase/permease subunit